MNSVSSTVAYALQNGLGYDPFNIPAACWTEEFVIILHGMVGDVKKDEDYSRKDYQWILAGFRWDDHLALLTLRQSPGRRLITESQLKLGLGSGATRNPLISLKQAASARGEILPSYMEDFLLSHEIKDPSWWWFQYFRPDLVKMNPF